MKKHFLFLPVVLFLFTVSIFAQTPNPSPTPPADDEDVVKISTTLIQVDVSVTDKEGKQVTDIKPEEFEVFENGSKQEITNFSYISVAPRTNAEATRSEIRAKNKLDKINLIPPVPTKLKPNEVRRTIALVVDDLGIAFSGLASTKDTLKRFVNEQMQPNDLVAIIRSTGGSGVFQQFTSDKRLLLASINKIKPNVFKIDSFTPLSNAAEDKGSTDRRDANYALGTIGAMNFLIKSMGQLPGRKTIILFSEGFILQDNPARRLAANSNASRDNSEILRNGVLRSVGPDNRQIYDEIGSAAKILIESANRASIVINTIDTRGLFEPMANASDGTFSSGQTAEGFSSNAAAIGSSVADRRNLIFDTQSTLIYLAEETGGRAFLNNNGFFTAVQKSIDDQNGYYLLGYEPDEETFDAQKRKFNKFEVHVKNRPELKVRYRSGFFGVTDDKLRPKAATPGQQLSEALFSPFDADAIDVTLTPVFSGDVKSGKSLIALVHMGGENLTFEKEANGTRKGSFEVLGITFDAGGKIIDRVAKIYTLNLKEENYQKMLEKGLVYLMNVPIKKPGAHQLKIAFRDTKSGKIGSSSQFVEIPNLEKNQLSLSGIFLHNFTIEEWKAKVQNANSSDANNQAAKNLSIQTDTATRRFKRGTLLNFGYDIYNAKTNSNMKPQLLSQIRLFHEGQILFEDKKEPLTINGQKLQTEGLLTLGKNLKPGFYVLQILVTDELAKGKNQIATQWIDFEVIN